MRADILMPRVGEIAKLNAPHRAGYRGTVAVVSGFLIAMYSLYNGNAVFTNGAVADKERRVYIYYASVFTRLRAGTGTARRFR